MRLPFRALPLIVLTGLGVAVAPIATAQGSPAPPGIPAVTSSTPAFGMVYEYVERTDRSPKDRDDLVSLKTRQYAEQVKEGSMTQARADEALQHMRTMPLREERRGTLTLIFDRGRVMVTGTTPDGRKDWTRIEDGVAVSRPWSGGTPGR